MLRKIEKMYILFGKADGKCKDCEHYKHWGKNQVCASALRKCEVYGITRSEASDWKAGYDACGLFPNKENPYDRDIIELRICNNRDSEEQIEGQINMFDNV